MATSSLNNSISKGRFPLGGIFHAEQEIARQRKIPLRARKIPPS
jgi:hypothetical protein